MPKRSDFLCISCETVHPANRRPTKSDWPPHKSFSRVHVPNQCADLTSDDNARETTHRSTHRFAQMCSRIIDRIVFTESSIHTGPVQEERRGTLWVRLSERKVPAIRKLRLLFCARDRLKLRARSELSVGLPEEIYAAREIPLWGLPLRVQISEG